MVRANTVANRFIEIARDKNETLTPMQLIKLIYIAHGWMLGLYNRPLISDPVEAWVYGPVIPSVYQEVKKYRSQPVTKPLKAPADDKLDAEEENLIKQVYEIYGRRSGIALSSLTHMEGSPWSIIWNDAGRNSRIPNDLIEYHFDSLVAKQVSEQGSEVSDEVRA